MLEPRWDTRGTMAKKFIGGTPDFDLWLTKDAKYIIALCGNNDDEWVGYRLFKGKFEDLWDDEINDAGDVARDKMRENHEEVLAYIQLFAPTVFEASFKRGE